ncbi:MAG: NAD(P)/FAD-dependent oxidoreductase [Endomicrobium sp.]|jgi:predicted Rossmann fold flavoprotein|nr:NAD(P)/FAD-dependent oxidoreductase [Endomicrobium sp.]
MSDYYDVLVIGAGPSGMIAADTAGQRKLKTAVVEKKSRPAIKLSITGKGKCNLTNSADIKDFVGVFRNGKFLYRAFTAFSNADLISYFEKLGVPCVLERGGRYFPASKKASDIADALIKAVKKNCEIISSFKAESVTKKDGLFFVRSDGGAQLSSKKLIAACGGMSYPSTGSQGDGYAFARSFGHSVTELSAALVPITLECANLKNLRGLKLKNVEVSVLKDGNAVLKEFGEMEFVSYGADGPVILTLSSYIGFQIRKSPLFLSLNLKPALSKPLLDKRLSKELNAFGRGQLQEMLKELLPARLIRTFADYCGLQITKKCSQINREERIKMLDSFYDMRFKITGVRDIKEAIITRGGVSTDEINQKTMESKLVSGLYFCGEILDVDAPTGGFNLQAAFSTGYLAGSSAASLETETAREKL